MPQRGGGGPGVIVAAAWTRDAPVHSPTRGGECLTGLSSSSATGFLCIFTHVGVQTHWYTYMVEGLTIHHMGHLDFQIEEKT